MKGDAKHLKKVFYVVALMEEISPGNAEQKCQYKLMAIIMCDAYLKTNNMQRYFTKEVFSDEREAVNSIKQWTYPLESKADLQPMFDRIGDSRIVMLGEASHGTHEYYTWRSHISKKLIEEKVSTLLL